MNIKICNISHKHISFSNRLVVTMSIEPYDEFFTQMENISLDVVIEKPEKELRLLTFADIEKLATERAISILKSITK
jgi:hypothetical protein